MNRSIGLLLLSLSLNYGCSSSSDSSGQTPVNEPASTQTGYFIDSPVANMPYRTETHSGVTGIDGGFSYEPGETLVFYIGDIAFPAVSAAGIVTPMDIAADDSTTLVNMLQFLQTLDNNGDPADGITIRENSSDDFAGSTADITSTDFDSSVSATLASRGLTLVSEDQAQSHFKNSLLGTWVISESPERSFLTFIDETRYIIFHEKEDVDVGNESIGQLAGTAEYGNYNWSLEDGSFSITLIDESDGWGGLNDCHLPELPNCEIANRLVIKNHNQIDFELNASSVDPEGTVISMYRIIDAADPKIGSWIFEEPENQGLHILGFVSATEYFMVHSNNQEAYDGSTPLALSGEMGSFALNSNIFTFTANVDMDGPGGMYDHDCADNCDPNYFAKEDGAIQLAFGFNGSNGFDDIFEFAYIGRYEVDLHNTDQDLSNTFVSRDSQGFSVADLQDKAFILTIESGTEEPDTIYDFAINSSGTITLSERDCTGCTSNADWTLSNTGVIEFTEDNDDAWQWRITQVRSDAELNNAEKVIVKIYSDSGEDPVDLLAIGLLEENLSP